MPCLTTLSTVDLKESISLFQLPAIVCNLQETISEIGENNLTLGFSHARYHKLGFLKKKKKKEIYDQSLKNVHMYSDLIDPKIISESSLYINYEESAGDAHRKI